MLDESVSHKIAKHLAAEHGLDVLAFHTVAKFGSPDFDVRATAKRLNRVLITLDSDFSALTNLFSPPPPGIVWIHPPRRKGKLKEEKQFLDRFFTQDAAGIDLDRSIVEVREFDSVILYPIP
jgi:predicted nuclease of predicted toxin-antitoxin system